ncbi:SusF/SusE family outer membrane protein [Alistipes sp.]|uniref:SusF/SusE family outer membrane protein n=1 Tax=Alistipes sp. TaxID=1872444 RepID=UPI0025BDBC58|nr:SusF/SusE family outer membrane protein [Alistipes sp.]
MKLKHLLMAGLMVFTFTACEDDPSPIMEVRQLATLNELPTSDIAITRENISEDFPAISWSPADYGVSAVIHYDVTLTNTTNGASKQVAHTDKNTTSLQMTNSEMLSHLADLGAKPGVTNKFEVSLKSSVYESAADNATNTVSFNASIYDANIGQYTQPTLYVAAGYPDWDFRKAYLLGDMASNGSYEGYAYFEQGGSFALLKSSDLSPLAEGQNVPDKGFYKIAISADGHVTVSGNLVWGLIGDATSGAWDKSTDMEYDPETRLWSVITSLKQGEFKFRANNGWDFNYGAEKGQNEVGGETVTGKLKHAGENFKLKETSPYIMTLNLTAAGDYSFSMEKTDIVQSSAFLTMPGSYQDWNPKAENCFKVTSPARDFKFAGTHQLPANTEFKFCDEEVMYGCIGGINWNETKTSGSFKIGEGENIRLEDAGYYRFFVDQTAMTATVDKTGWEIIGDATPGGWDKGQLMTHNPADNSWSIVVEMKEGSFKFRWDAAWAVNLGGDLGALTQDGDNIPISAGKYKIVLYPDESRATTSAE